MDKPKSSDDHRTDAARFEDVAKDIDNVREKRIEANHLDSAALSDSSPLHHIHTRENRQDSLQTSSSAYHHRALDFSKLVRLRSAVWDFTSGNECTHRTSVDNNFLKGAAFSPDGTCLLTASEDTILRVFELNLDKKAQGEEADLSNEGRHWRACLHSEEGETIYDFAWYPHMSSAEPTTCVYVSTSRDHPLHMWDAFTGRLRASYRAYDHLDEVVAANSVSFNTSGTKLFAGYNRMIRVFDISQPGRSFEARPTCKTRKSPVGQRGIISCLAFSPDPAGGGIFAAGSYARTVCLYSENSRGRAIAELSTPRMGGVTHVKFSPEGRYLFSGSRRDPHIACWDIRKADKVLCIFRRRADTNQRITFDIDPTGRYLATGSTSCQALVYDVLDQRVVGNLDNQCDAVGGVCFHPHNPLLGIYTGQRHFGTDSASDSEGDTDMLRPTVSSASEDTPSRNEVSLYSIGLSSTRPVNVEAS